MQDLAFTRPVIMKQPDRPHAFQRSDLNHRCAVCAGRFAEIIHIDAPANYWRIGGWWRLAGQF